MNTAQSLLQPAPITAGRLLHNPRVLLGGSHQPSLLRYLDNWPGRWAQPRTFRIQFVQPDEALSRFARDSFDLAVIPAPAAERLGETLGDLLRVARQGLITRRQA